MWKVIRKGLWANKVRYLLTAIAVVLGVAFISGTFVLTATIGKSFDDLFGTIYNKTDAIVRAKEVLSGDQFGGGQRPNFPESVIDVVRSVPTVSAASGNVDFNTSFAQLIDKNGDAIGGTGGAPTMGLAWNPNPTLNQFNLVAGRAPTHSNEIVIDKHSADLGKFNVGDTVMVATQFGQPAPYKLVGIAKFGTADSLLGATMTMFTLPEAQRINNSVDKFGQISVAAKNDVSQQQVRDDIAAALKKAGEDNIEVLTGKQITKESQDQVRKATSFFNIALTAFGVIALLVGAFIIYNTFSITVAQRAREMALLRALGASQRQVMGQVTLEAVAVGVIASAIGVVAGIGLALALKALLDAVGFGLPKMQTVVPPIAIIAGLLVGVGFTLVSAIFPARQAARIPPIAALRDYSLEQRIRRVPRFVTGAVVIALGVISMAIGLFTSIEFGPLTSIWLVVIGAVVIFAGAVVLGPVFSPLLSRVIGAPIAKIRGITGSLSRENAARHPKRTTITAIPLVIGVALVGFITIFAASAKATVTHAVDTQFKSDFLITAGSGFSQGGFSPALAESIGKLPEVAAQTGVRFGMAGINGKSTPVNGVDPQAGELVDFGDVSGTWADLKDDGIAISKRKADEQHWKVGDTIPVTFVKTGSTPLRVDYIYKQNTFGDYFLSTGNFEKNFDQNLDFLVMVRLKDGVSAEQGRNAIQPLVDKYPTAKLRDNAQYKQDQVAQFNGLITAIYVLLFLSVIIAMIGIANTLILSIHERTHEVGLLRAVGMGRAQVRSSIRWESVIICLIGTFNGIAIGLFFGWAFVRALRDEGFSQFAIAPQILLAVVIALAVLAIVAAFFPARRAAKLDILRAIATE